MIGRLFSVCTLLIFVGLTTGCRFGNKVEGGPTSDGITGYYETQPQKLSFCATVSGQAPQCAEALPNLVPRLISQSMTNPVALILTDAATDEAAFVAPGSSGRSSIPVYASADGTLSYLGSGVPFQAWDDSNCVEQLYIDEVGKWKKGGPLNTGSPLRVVGRVQLTMRVFLQYEPVREGLCASTMKTMQNCYFDQSLCGGPPSEASTRQNIVQSMFDDYIKVGVLKPEQIGSLTGLAYQIEYE